MSLTELFVRRPTLVTVLLLLILLGGTIAGSGLVTQALPSAVIPSIQVTFRYPGASTSEMQDTIARPVEDQLAGSANLSHLTTTIETGKATMVATFSLDSDANNDLVQVQGRIQNAQRSLPNDLQAPEIAVASPDAAIVVSLAISAPHRSFADLSSLVTNKLVPSLEQLPGVSAVESNGGVTPAIMVAVDPLKISSSGATITDVISTLTNNNVRAPGGILYAPNRETNLDIRGDIQDAPTVADLLLSAGSGSGPTGTDIWQTQNRLLRVADVAQVRDSFETQRSYAFVQGRPCITLDILKSSGQSEVTVADAVIAALPALEQTYPGLTITVLNVQATATHDQLAAVIRTLIEAIAFTSIVMLFFLRSWRNAIVTALAIPSSLLVTLIVMRLAHFTLDTVSLLAMTLIIGILVDDSIVVLENVERHLSRGETPRVAALRGRNEIGLAAVVITLVDVVVFLPISFLPGATGLFLREFGVVVTSATLTSLLISFTVTPTLAARWALTSTWQPWPIIERFTQGFARLRAWYCERVLPASFSHPKIIFSICGISLAFAAAVLPLGLVGSELFPPVDRGEINITIRFPSGTPLERTRRETLAAEAVINDRSDIATEATTVGAYRAEQSGYVEDAAVGQIELFLKSSHRNSTAAMATELAQLVAKRVTHARIIAIPATDLQGGTAQPLSYLVASRSNAPAAAAAQVAEALRRTPGTTNVTNSDAGGAPQIGVHFDRERARVLGLSLGVGASAVAAAFGGDVATQFTGPDGLKDVLVTYPLRDQNSLAELGAIPVRSNNGGLIHLGDVLRLRSDPAPPLIVRFDRHAVIAIGANLVPGAVLSNVQRDFANRLRRLDLPADVLVGPDLNSTQSELPSVLQNIAIVLALSAALIYLLMVALYNNYRLPAIIMFAIPVAAVGSLGALALRQQTLNLFSLIGTVLLLGLVTKNGILLVDFAAREQARGISARAAMEIAARERFRPILMTTVAMIAGMTPLALDLDPGAAAGSLGTVVIGGLLSSLLLTLVLVPLVYVYFGHQKPSASMTPGAQYTE